jgi:hypothetical protein
VAANDLGELGPEEGAPVIYYWNPLWHLMRMAPWLILLLVLARKPNRNKKALVAPVAALAVAVAVGLITMALALTGIEDQAGMGQALALVALGLATVWLLADEFAGMDRVLAFFAAGAVMALVGVIGTPCVMGLSPGMILCAFLYLICAGAVMLGLLFGGVFCRKQYSPERFLGWFSLCVVGIPFAITLGFGCLLALVMMFQAGAAQALGLAGMAAGTGLVVGICLWAVTAPFMGLALRMRFYRDRFHRVYALTGMEVES